MNRLMRLNKLKILNRLNRNNRLNCLNILNRMKNEGLIDLRTSQTKSTEYNKLTEYAKFTGKGEQNKFAFRLNRLNSLSRLNKILY